MSQLRVRELIRKGKIVAEKVVDAAGERWNIAAESVHSYLDQRPPKEASELAPAAPSEAAPSEAAPRGASPNGIAALVGGLEQQIAHLQTIVRDIKRTLEHDAAPPEPPAPAPAPEVVEEPAPPVVESSNGSKAAVKPKPKAAAKAAKTAKPVKVEAPDKTPLGAALQQAGVVEQRPRSKKSK